MAHRDAAKAAVDRLEAEVAKYRIVAPIDGVIIAREVDLGETVTSLPSSQSPTSPSCGSRPKSTNSTSPASPRRRRRQSRPRDTRSSLAPARSKRSPTLSLPVKLVPKTPAARPIPASSSSGSHSGNRTH